jgi:hypothetical protein
MKKVIMMLLVLVFCMVAEITKADCTFGEPENLGPMINNSGVDVAPCVSADGLELYFHREEPDGEIRVARRATPDDEWGPSSNLGPTVNSPSYDGGPCLSADGLSLYFFSERPGGFGGSGADIWVTTRTTVEDTWSTPVNLGATVNSGGAWAPTISTDGLELYFPSERSGGYGATDLWVTTRASVNDSWGTPVNLGPMLNTSANENWPGISADGLVLFFSSNRSGGYGSGVGLFDIYMVRRKTTKDPWGPPMNLGPVVNSNAYDVGAKISADCSILYFHSPRPGGNGDADIWQVPIETIFDLNSDLKIDLADMQIILDHWGEDYSLCDISPTPFGDGIVDIQDMIVLAENLYRLTAHWKFDEAEDNIAYDSVGDHDGTLNGNPTWLPTGGTMGGALLFDGIDDYVETPFILDPTNGSFSVFAWISCWTPGQVIISQSNTAGARGTMRGSTWLGINSSEGTLMTGFSDVNFGALESESVITDIQWHHVGFVYDTDTFYRRLYVDGILVVQDTSAVSGAPSEGGVYIGASKDLDSTSFFSGMIDDVRIYKQALTTEEIAALAQ